MGKHLSAVGRPATEGSFKKGDDRAKGRPPGRANYMTTEVKEVLARVFHEGLGGYDAFLDWVNESDEHKTIFYSKLWIKLLPIMLNVHSEVKREIKTYHELSIEIANRGVSLDSIEKLKRLDLDAERPPEET
jgi:hypothetical protein